MKIVYLLVFSFLFTACGSSGKDKSTQGTRFYYYPGANVYLDIENETYFQLDPAQGWSANELTEDQVAALGEKVFLDHPELPVWKNNETHKMVYSVGLYAPKDYQKKLIEDSLKMFPPKTNDSVAPTTGLPETKKERSGIGKFFDKIFRKKKKDE